MDSFLLFKGIIDSDTAPIVICDTNHIIIYMNSSAVNRYSQNGGKNLVGKSIMCCHNEKSAKLINQVVNWFNTDVDNNVVHTFYNKSENKDVYMVAIRDDNKKLIGYYEKHEYRNVDKSEFYNLT